MPKEEAGLLANKLLCLNLEPVLKFTKYRTTYLKIHNDTGSPHQRTT